MGSDIGKQARDVRSSLRRRDALRWRQMRRQVAQIQRAHQHACARFTQCYVTERSQCVYYSVALALLHAGQEEGHAPRLRNLALQLFCDIVGLGTWKLLS